jgi:hypothetical protein
MMKPSVLAAALISALSLNSLLDAASNKLSLDLQGLPNNQLDCSEPAINTLSAFNADYDGTGVGIAVIDSGINAHPDLRGLFRVVYSKNYVQSANAAAQREADDPDVVSRLQSDGILDGVDDPTVLGDNRTVGYHGAVTSVWVNPTTALWGNNGIVGHLYRRCHREHSHQPSMAKTNQPEIGKERHTGE